MSRPTAAPAAARTAAPTVDRPALALAVVVTCQLMLVLDATVMNVALPGIQASLGFSPGGLAWVMSSYTLTFGGLLLLGGRAGDIYGRRRVFIAGLALFTVASLAGGLATSAGWLLAARVGQGIGAAAAGPSTLALITTTVTEPRARVRALALLSAVASAGFAIGLVVGGLLTEMGSWRWVLFINVPFGVAAILLAPRVVREPQRHPGRLDVPGALTASLGVTSLVYGLLHVAVSGWASGATRLALAAAVVLLGSFVLIEQRSAAPLLPLRLFADRARAAAYGNFLLGPAAMMSTFFFLTQYLQDIRRWGALETGLAFLPLAAAIFASTRLVPRLLPRTGARPFAMLGGALMIAGLTVLTGLSTHTGYWPVIAAAMALLGLGAGLGFVPLTPAIMARVEPREAGAASGALQTMQQLGASLGIAVLVPVFAHAAGPTPTPQRFVDGMTAVFPVSALIAVGTLVVAVLLGRSAAAMPRGDRSADPVAREPATRQV